MTALLVTAELSDAVVYSEDYLHLDGILSVGVYRGMSADEQAALPDLRTPWAEDLDLPLAKWTCEPTGDFDERLLDEDGLLWGWVASIELDPWHGFGTTEYRKRPPLAEMRRYTNKKTVNIGSGQLKAYDLSFPTVRSAHQTWYCEGDADGVRAALSRVSAIGRKHNTGYGTVRRWTVVQTEKRDCPRVYPVTYSPHGGHRRGARIRPPYHHRSRNVSDCVVPETS